MKIKRWDWDKQVFIWDEYPQEMFENFLNWLLRTKMWVENPDMVVEHVRSLDRELLAYRTPANTHHEGDVVVALEDVTQPVGDVEIPPLEWPVETKPMRSAEQQEKYRLAGLKRSETMRKKREAKERRKAALAAKKEIVHAEG